METWYRARFGEIEEIRVVKESTKYVYYENGARTKKESDWQWFSKDREEAKRMMIERYKKELAKAKNAISSAKERIKKAEMA